MLSDSRRLLQLANRLRRLRARIRTVVLTVALSAAWPAAAEALPPVSPETCVGDEDDDGLVSVDELIEAVGIAFGRGSDYCMTFDANRPLGVDIGDLTAAVADSLHGCGAVRRADLSGFQEFRFERRNGLGFCPPIGEVFAASIVRDRDAFVFQASRTEMGERGVDDCLEVPFGDGADCLVVRSEPQRALRQDEIARVVDAFDHVAIRDAPHPACRGCSIDPCLINAVAWDGVRATDYVCEYADRIDDTQMRSIVELLEDLREGASADTSTASIAIRDGWSNQER